MKFVTNAWLTARTSQQSLLENYQFHLFYKLLLVFIMETNENLAVITDHFGTKNKSQQRDVEP